MSNRFDNLTARPAMDVSRCETTYRIGREAFDTLMGLLAEDQETPTTPLGVFVANSTKRNLKHKIEVLFKP